MKRGISFLIPNEYDRWLARILKPVDCSAYTWWIGAAEMYQVVDGNLIGMIDGHVMQMEGELLNRIIHMEVPQYIIFADLKAFPNGKAISTFCKFEEFMESECALILLIVDSIYAAIYCKDQVQLERLYENARMNGVESLAYITEDNDHRTRLSFW
ncbi:hypothetical protein J2T17_005759 [Paenibacillus mucilaginosus]|uniref:DUF2691 family protein n=1 Tax=Paenibacillus mucilaginosus TaxID=61624 RepID=UPI003D1DDADB